MRLIIYISLVFLSVCIAWQLGNAAHGSAGNFLILAVAIMGANFFLTRRQCLTFAAISLILGVLVPIIVWTYGHLYIQGDSSGYGMLGTLLVVVFVPTGLGLLFVGWRKR
jgi:hypothetical protein